MTTVRNDEVGNMMCQAASRDLAEPMQAVESALSACLDEGSLDSLHVDSLMTHLHAALVAQGHDPSETL